MKKFNKERYFEEYEREFFRLVQEKYRGAGMLPTHFGRAVWGAHGARALAFAQMLLPENNPTGESRVRHISLIDVARICAVFNEEPSKLMWELEQRLVEKKIVLQEESISERLVREGKLSKKDIEQLTLELRLRENEAGS